MTTSPRKPSESAVRRLSLYLRALEELQAEGEVSAPSELLALRAGTTAAQVRKDLSAFGSFGRRGLGYPIDSLRVRLHEILGLSRKWRVALIGAGRIGAALFEYPHFRKRGFEIVAIFDADPEKTGTRWRDITIRPAAEMEEGIQSEKVQIVILAVPATSAQTVAARAVSAGVSGILNFAPVQLQLPPNVEVNDVDMAVELEALTFSLHARKRS